MMNISKQPRCSFSITRTVPVNDEYFRAATLIVTDDPVPRDIFYNGRLKNERGAVVLRVAPSWFRYPAKISRSRVRFLSIPYSCVIKERYRFPMNITGRK
jgi:hypothetical protein